MRVLLLLSYCSEVEEKKLLNLSKVGLLNSIISFQRNLERGISLNRIKYDIINFYPIGTFPKYSKALFFNWKRTRFKNGCVYTQLFIFNLLFFKQILLYLQANIAVKYWINKHKNEEKIIIMYDLLWPYVNILGNLKHTHKVTTYSLIADLPNQYGYKKNLSGLRAFFQRKMGENSLKIINNINYFGLVTQHIAKIIGINENRFTIIEGFSNIKRQYIPLKEKSKDILMYTGALYEIYGLDMLLQSFIEIENPNIELWLCGSGDFVDTIKDKAKLDKRIKYLGYKTHEEIALLQTEATLLINPRMNNGEYTKFSFPSKIIEYLGAGRPVIAYKLDGIPDDYYDFIISPPDNSALSLKNTISHTLSLPFIQKKVLGERGRNFILNRTNPKYQIEKLLNLKGNI